jgi:integrase
MPTDDRCIFAELDHAGRACIVVSKYWPDGSRFRRRFPNKTVAKKMRARIEEAIAMGTWRELKRELYEDPKRDLTIEQFSDIYLEEYCRIRNSRPDFKEETLTTIVSIVGHIRVKEFTRAHAKHFEAERAKSVKGATVNRGLAVLSNMLTFALDKGMIEVHPMVRYRRIPEERRAIRVMTVAEERALVEATLRKDLAVGVYCGLLGETAMRPEEGLRQQWSFVNLSERLLTVDKSKTKRARHIPLSDYAMELLQMVPRIVGCPYVVARLETLDRLKDPRGTFHAARKSVNLDWVTFRDFRHFRASQWVMSGIDLKTVQELMGHSDIHTTMRYAHFASKHATRSIIEAQRIEAGRWSQAQQETNRRHLEEGILEAAVSDS